MNKRMKKVVFFLGFISILLICVACENETDEINGIHSYLPEGAVV